MFAGMGPCKDTDVRIVAPGQISGCKVAGRLRGGDQAVQLAGRLVRADAAVRHLCQERCQLGVWRRAVLGAWAMRKMVSQPDAVHHDHQAAVRAWCHARLHFVHSVPLQQLCRQLEGCIKCSALPQW